MTTYMLAELAELRMAELRRVGPAHEGSRPDGSRRRLRTSVGRILVRWGERLAAPAPRPATQ
jgi:hypothetical protein